MSKETKDVKQEPKNKTHFELKLITDLNGETKDWTAVFEEEGERYEATAATPLDSLKKVLDEIELANIKDIQKRNSRQMVLLYPDALALALNIQDILEDASKSWFTIYQLMVKTKGQTKETILEKLKFLSYYKIVESETDKKISSNTRWRFIESSSLQKHKLEQEKLSLESKLQAVTDLLDNIGNEKRTGERSSKS